MRVRRSIAFVAAVAALGWTVGAASAEEGHEKGHRHEAVSMDKLPQGVKDGLAKAANGGKLENVRSETEDGKTYYEADVMQGGRHTEVRVDSTGKASPEDDDDDDEGS